MSRITVALITLVLVFASSYVALAADPVTLIVAVAPDDRVVNPSFDEAFAQEYPHIKVEFIGRMNAETFITRYVAGVAPDIWLFGADVPINLGPEGYLLDLTSYLEKTPEFRYHDDYIPLAQEPFEIGEAVYGLAYDVGALAVYYRTNLFDEVGVKRPWFEFTIDDFAEAARKLTVVSPDGEVERWGARGYWNWWANAPALGGFGATLYDRDRNVVLDPPDKAAQAMAWWTDLFINQQAAHPNYRDINAGDAAMVFNGTWAYWVWNSAFDGLTEIAPVPMGPEGRRTTMSGSALGISANSQHKEEAWTYLSQLLGVENSHEWLARLGPVRFSGMPLFGLEWGERGRLPQAILQDAIEGTGIYRPILPSELASAINPHINQVINGELDPYVGVEIVRDLASGILGEN